MTNKRSGIKRPLKGSIQEQKMLKKKINRRLRRIPIDPRQIFALFELSKGKILDVEGYPDGSQYVGVSFDAPSNTWQMFISHPSFEEVPENKTIPELLIQIKVLGLVESGDTESSPEQDTSERQESVQPENASELPLGS